MPARTHTSHPLAGGVAPALIALLAALLLCLPAAAHAQTRTFPPVKVARGVATFAPTGIDARAVSSAQLVSTKGRSRVKPRAVRRGIRAGLLRLRVRGMRKLRLRVRVSKRMGTRPSVRPTQPAPAADPSSAPSTEPEPTPVPEPAPETAPETSPAPAPAPAPAPEPEPAPAPQPEPTPSSQPAPALPVPSDAHYVSSSTGNDAWPGTKAQPWRTLAKAADSARAGDFVVLLPGTYGALGTTTNISRSGTPSEPIVFTSEPGSARAVVRGYVRITGSHLHIDSLLFDGPTGPVLSKTSSNPGGEEVQVSIMNNSNVELSHSEVRENAWHAGVYVYNATDIRIRSNYIHDNGDPVTGPNLDHGIYWCSGSGTIANNLVEDNVAYGLHLYPDAANVVASHNTIVGQGRGGIIVANDSAGNQLINNLVADNKMYGIRAYELSGPDNVGRNNLVWNNGTNLSGSGIALSGTIQQDPLFVNSTLKTSASSPIVDRGAFTGEREDYAGVARPSGGAPDIGAYEIR